MNILLAVDTDDADEAKLCKINDVKKWAMLVLVEGRITEILFANTREEFDLIAQTVVIIDDNEYVWPFIEEQMQVLVAHTQRYIDDIVEAYLFKELHELAY
jgi:hypothetical protein